MSLYGRIKEEEFRHAHMEAVLVAEIEELILNLPDNPDIERLSKNAFILSNSDMTSGSWSPISYDFKAQYRAIMDLMTDVPIGKGLKKIEKALKNQSIMRNNRTQRPIHLHPCVISNVQSVLDGV